MTMAINERFIRLRPQKAKADRIITEKDFVMDQEVTLVIRGQIVEIKHLSTDSEEIDVEYIVKGEIDLNEGGI